MRRLSFFAYATPVLVCFACGSADDQQLDSNQPSGGGNAGNLTGSSPSGYTCVPDDAPGAGDSSDSGTVTTKNADLGTPCPPGTHAVSTGDGGNDSGTPGLSGGAEGGSGSTGGDGGSEGTGSGGGGPLPPTPQLCTAGGINTEPFILVGYSPANGQSVGANGQIKVWISDEGAPKIAPGEVVDPNTGAITTPGDRTAKAADGYLWEPALYIAPQTAESGGTPHFPDFIKGSYNNNPATFISQGTLVQGMDPAPNGAQPFPFLSYMAEDIWNVSSLGLSPGTYIAEFVIHDGDRDRGVGCVTIAIQ
jgi:hypothetical protein